MRFRALSESQNTEFKVASDVIDRHIKIASGIYFKVLLAILRNDRNKISSDELGESIGISPEEIEEAAGYWIRSRVLPESVVLKDIETPDGEDGADKAAKREPGGAVTLSAKEISQLAKSNSEVSFLFSGVESLLARPVTATEQKVLVSVYEWVGLPADVILMLFDYCLSIGKKSIRYIEKVAISWADEGITTHELAEEKIKALKENDELSAEIKSAFGIYGRNLTAAEKKYITKWFESLKLPLDMVTYANEITVNNTGKISFAYINKILESWSEKGFKTLEEAKAENSGKRPGQGNKNKIHFENDSFDVNEFENMGIYNIPEVND